MKNKGKIFAIAGISLQLGGPIFGLIGTIIGMIMAFNTMGGTGADNSEQLANNISVALITTAIGLVIAMVGLVFNLLAIFVFKYRAAWFFWVLIVTSALILLRFPIGTLISLFMLIYLVSRKDEYLSRPKEQ